MPEWNTTYVDSLSERFNALTNGLSDRLEDVVAGRVTPTIDNITIGSGRMLNAAVLFFDIREFSSRTSSANVQTLKKTLLMLDCIIPMVMHVIYDHGGYVEKNTGDGVMGIIGADANDYDAANDALDAAMTIFYVLRTYVNPFLAGLGIDPVDARIGIDLGQILVARIGVPTGAAPHPRNFLTAVGPAANIACRLQELAGTNEIYVGNNVWRNSRPGRSFTGATPYPWKWVYVETNTCYFVWRLDDIWTTPYAPGSLYALLARRLPPG